MLHRDTNQQAIETAIGYGAKMFYRDETGFYIPTSDDDEQEIEYWMVLYINGLQTIVSDYLYEYPLSVAPDHMSIQQAREWLQKEGLIDTLKN